METKIDRIEIRHFGENHNECIAAKDRVTTRLSVYVNDREDNHHIEFDSDVNRFELSGILIRLAHLLSRGVE